MGFSHIALTLYIGVIVYCLFKFISNRVSRAKRQQQFSRQHGCEPIHTKYPHKDPFYGIDVFIRNIKAITKHQFLETVTRRHDDVGETYQLNMLGTIGMFRQRCTRTVSSHMCVDQTDPLIQVL